MTDAPIHTPKLAAVIGSPVGHSLSPHIHNEWARREGVNGHYVAIDVADDDAAFERAISAMRELGFSGANVTIPHKERALKIASSASAAATKAGAANMLTFDDGELRADNSDIFGLEQAVRAAASSALDALDMSSASALILGAGGAARGVAIALQQLGFSNICVANRSIDKAEHLAKRFELSVTKWEERTNALAEIDLVVNTTSLGMVGQPALDFDVRALKPSAIIGDIVYAPLVTPLLERAKNAGHPIFNGLDMLMHQAVPGFNAWLGQNAVVDAPLREMLIDILDGRS